MNIKQLKEKQLKEFEKTFDHYNPKNDTGEFVATFSGSDYYSIKAIISKFQNELIEAVIDDVIQLSNKIELENETVFDEWRAFKCFRNKLRDEINKLK